MSIETQSNPAAVQAVHEYYPFNLLTDIVGQTNLVPPEAMTDDRCHGLQYALATLEKREQEVIRRRYQDYQSRGEISRAIDLSIERVRQIEHKAITKLRYPSRWNYIKLGIVGYLSHRVRESHTQGYHSGYSAGYQNGVYDTQHGVKLTSLDNEQLHLPIECMNLSTRALHCLMIANLKTIGDVARVSGERIPTMRSLGKKSADEIARALQALGIHNTEWEPYILTKI